MKTILTVILTATYVLGASATYSADRERGRASCWENESLNKVGASAGVAILWPLYVIAGGIAVTMTWRPIDRLCDSPQFLKSIPNG